MLESSTADDGEATGRKATPSKSNSDQKALGCAGLLCLMIGVVFAMLAPVIGGLSGLTDSPSDANFSASQPIPLGAHRKVAFDLRTPTVDGTQTCKVTGPDQFSFTDDSVDDAGKFTTKSKGDYYIACDGSNVIVRNDAGGHPAVDIQEQHGKTTTKVLFVMAGIFFVLGIVAFIASGRSNSRKNAIEADGRPAEGR